MMNELARALCMALLVGGYLALMFTWGWWGIGAGLVHLGVMLLAIWLA